MKEIVIATRNPGKLEEFKVLMKDLEVELRSLEEWPNVPEPEETGKTFMAICHYVFPAVLRHKQFAGIHCRYRVSTK